jgi:D-alanyl-D-alanine carboxypeptidase
MRSARSRSSSWRRAILRLTERGKLRLDDTLGAYVPEFPTHGQRVTLRDLLRHTSGIRGGARMPGRNGERIDYSREELVRTLAAIYADRQPEFRTGTAWAYQSINYTLLGLVVERVSAQLLWDYLRKEFLIPIGMTATALCDPTTIVKHRATGYVSGSPGRGGLAVPSFFSPTVLLGGAGLCSTAPDLLRWQRALVEHQALSAPSYARMTRPEPLSDGSRPDYSYAIAVWPVGSDSMRFHTGGMPGFTAFLAHLPARDLTVIVLINANADILAIGPAVVRIASGLPQPTELATSHEELSRYVGKYASGGVTVDVREEKSHLVAKVDGANSLRFLFAPRLLKQGDREFAVNWEPEARLTFLPARERAEEVVLRYAGRTVRLRRAE